MLAFRAPMFSRGAVAAGGATDPDFASVVLLMGMEGSDGSTTFPDEGPAARGNANFNGSAQLDTAQFKFGASSLLLDGAGDAINYADNADWELGAGAFTIECFYRTNTVTGLRRVIAKRGTLGSRSFILQGNGTNLQWVMCENGSTEFTDLSAGTLTTGTWHWLVISFNGSKYRLRLDGAMIASSTTVRTIHNNTSFLTIGADGSLGNGVDGWIDELRITKGVDRYDTDSNVTVPTAAFPRS